MGMRTAGEGEGSESRAVRETSSAARRWRGEVGEEDVGGPTHPQPPSTRCRCPAVPRAPPLRTTTTNSRVVGSNGETKQEER
uniref:Uncharacterized protein n=1 Tax=Oryza rufipogon TaxID=4529 RepID=A0A0E0PVG0_ORYRU